MKYLRIIFRYVYVAVLPSRQRLVIGHISEGVAPGYYFLTSSLLFAIRWRTMIISELRRIIGCFWVAQAKKCILCTMYVRKKHNRSGSTSVVVVSKASGKYREIKSGSSEIWSDA